MHTRDPNSHSGAQNWGRGRGWHPARPAPAHFAPGRAVFVCLHSVHLTAGCTAIVDHIPTFSLAPSLLLTVKFSRAAGAPGWFPGVPVKVFRMKEACFSDF